MPKTVTQMSLSIQVARSQTRSTKAVPRNIISILYLIELKHIQLN